MCTYLFQYVEYRATIIIIYIIDTKQYKNIQKCRLRFIHQHEFELFIT